MTPGLFALVDAAYAWEYRHARWNRGLDRGLGFALDAATLDMREAAARLGAWRSLWPMVSHD